MFSSLSIQFILYINWSYRRPDGGRLFNMKVKADCRFSYSSTRRIVYAMRFSSEIVCGWSTYTSIVRNTCNNTLKVKCISEINGTCIVILCILITLKTIYWYKQPCSYVYKFILSTAKIRYFLFQIFCLKKPNGLHPFFWRLCLFFLWIIIRKYKIQFYTIFKLSL